MLVEEALENRRLSRGEPPLAIQGKSLVSESSKRASLMLAEEALEKRKALRAKTLEAREEARERARDGLIEGGPSRVSAEIAWQVQPEGGGVRVAINVLA